MNPPVLQRRPQRPPQRRDTDAEHIIALTAVEMGMITPPFGLNIFVINAMARDVPMSETYKGVLPFVVSDVVRLGIILFVPATALYIPGLM